MLWSMVCCCTPNIKLNGGCCSFYSLSIDINCGRMSRMGLWERVYTFILHFPQHLFWWTLILFLVLSSSLFSSNILINLLRTLLQRTIWWLMLESLLVVWIENWGFCSHTLGSFRPYIGKYLILVVNGRPDCCLLLIRSRALTLMLMCMLLIVRFCIGGWVRMQNCHLRRVGFQVSGFYLSGSI